MLYIHTSTQEHIKTELRGSQEARKHIHSLSFRKQTLPRSPSRDFLLYFISLCLVKGNRENGYLGSRFQSAGKKGREEWAQKQNKQKKTPTIRMKIQTVSIAGVYKFIPLATSAWAVELILRWKSYRAAWFVCSKFWSYTSPDLKNVSLFAYVASLLFTKGTLTFSETKKPGFWHQLCHSVFVGPSEINHATSLNFSFSSMEWNCLTALHVIVTNTYDFVRSIIIFNYRPSLSWIFPEWLNKFAFFLLHQKKQSLLVSWWIH